MNLPFVAPSNWRTVPFKEIITDSAFGPRFSGESYATDGNVATLRTTDLEEDGRISYATMPLARLDEGKFQAHFLKHGDLVITRSGTCGIAAVFDCFDLPVLPGAFLIRFRLTTEGEPKFYRYFFNSRMGREHLLSVATGAVQQNLNITNVSKLDVPLPPLRDQHAIVSVLSTYDDLIENNTRRIKILEQMAQMIYREWFVNFRFPGHENVRMVGSEFGRIPEGWSVQLLPDLCSKVIDGTHDSPPQVEDGYFLVTGKHFTSGFIDFDACYRISPDEHEKVLKRSKPESGDILFSNIGTLGSIAMVPTQPTFSIKNVALFKPKTRAHSTFLYCYFRLPESLEVLHQKASGTSQKFWSLQFLRSLPLLTPSETVITHFHRRVEPLLSYRLLLNAKNTNLRTTRDLLLPKLISGEIPVEAADGAAAELAAQPA